MERSSSNWKRSIKETASPEFSLVSFNETVQDARIDWKFPISTVTPTEIVTSHRIKSSSTKPGKSNRLFPGRLFRFRNLQSLATLSKSPKIPVTIANQKDSSVSPRNCNRRSTFTSSTHPEFPPSRRLVHLMRCPFSFKKLTQSPNISKEFLKTLAPSTIAHRRMQLNGFHFPNSHFFELIKEAIFVKNDAETSLLRP